MSHSSDLVPTVARRWGTVTATGLTVAKWCHSALLLLLLDGLPDTVLVTRHCTFWSDFPPACVCAPQWAQWYQVSHPPGLGPRLWGRGGKLWNYVPGWKTMLKRRFVIFCYLDFLTFISIFPVNLGLSDLKNFKKSKSGSQITFILNFDRCLHINLPEVLPTPACSVCEHPFPHSLSIMSNQCLPTFPGTLKA